MRSNLREIGGEQREVFRDALAELVDLSGIGPEVREGELLGLVLELELRIRPGLGEAQERRHGVGEMVRPFVGQAAPGFVATGEEPDLFGMRGDVDVFQGKGADQAAKLPDCVGHRRLVAAA